MTDSTTDVTALTARLEAVTQERDEARAELAECKLSVAGLVGLCDKWLERYDELRIRCDDETDRLRLRLLAKRAELALDRIIRGYELARAASCWTDEPDLTAERRVATWARRYECVRRILTETGVYAGAG